MNHIITLVLGDWSHDGHEKTETINIRSNLLKAGIEEAYALGTEKLGFDFCKEIAADYEDNMLDNEKWEALKKLGYQDDDLEEDGIKYNEGDISLWTDSFTDIYLFIVKLGNDEFEFEYLSEVQNPQIKIGGYGLFY